MAEPRGVETEAPRENRTSHLHDSQIVKMARVSGGREACVCTAKARGTRFIEARIALDRRANKKEQTATFMETCTGATSNYPRQNTLSKSG